MRLSIRTDVSALNANRHIGENQRMLESSISRLSSGYRITTAGDDAAGLGLSVDLESQIRSLNQALRNANDGMSLLQTAEGNLNQVTNILSRMRELAMESASDGIAATQRAYIETEADQLRAELDRIESTAEYNGNVFFGAASALVFQIGIRGTTNDTLKIDTSTMKIDANDLGVDAGTFDLGVDATTSQAALPKLDDAINLVMSYRAQLGALDNRLQGTVDNLSAAQQNLTAAHGRIRDVDVGEESARLARSAILSRSSVAVLAQANQTSQQALRLLGAA